SGSNGVYAEIIANADQFADYVARVSREHFAILVQPYIRAPEYRVFVLDGRALFSYRKYLPNVVGDGCSTLRKLIAIPAREHAASLVRDEAGALVALDDVIEKGARITLEGPSNRAAGGGAEALRDGAPQPMATLAIAAAKAIGLRLAAVDMFDLG